MMSYDISVIAKLDDRELKEKEAMWKQRIAKLNNEVQTHSRNWGRTIRGTLSAITMTTAFLRRLLARTAGALGPVYDAILNAVMQTAYSLQAIAAAYGAGLVTAPIAAIVESAAIALSIWGIAYAIMGQQEMNAEMYRIRSLVDTLGSTVSSYGRMYDQGGF